MPGSADGTGRSMSRSGRDPIGTDWLKNLAADQPRTALVSSVFELLDRTEDEQPAAIVLVTDGRDNASSRSFSDWASCLASANGWSKSHRRHSRSAMAVSCSSILRPTASPNCPALPQRTTGRRLKSVRLGKSI